MPIYQGLFKEVGIILMNNIVFSKLNPYIEELKPIKAQRCLHGVMVKTVDCRIIVSEFKLSSHYYVHFQANNHGKGMKPLILYPPSYQLNSTTTVLQDGWLRH